MVKNEDVVRCFLYGINKKSLNLISVNGFLLFFGNKIAEKTGLNTISIWFSYASQATLKILNMLPNVNVEIIKGELFFNSNIWDGKSINISNEILDI